MTEAKAKVPGIYGKIAKITEEIGNIPKNGVMKFGSTNYSYIKADDILEKLHESLVANDVIVRPHVEAKQDVREAGANKFFVINSVTLTTTFIDVADGSEHTVVAAGESGEIGDKGLRKAITQAQKVTNLLTFAIASGEPDPDGQQPNLPKDEPAKTPPKQVADLGALKKEVTEQFALRGIVGEDAMTAAGDKYFAPRTGWINAKPALEKLLAALKAGEVIE
jgi:hypothetical protein